MQYIVNSYGYYPTNKHFYNVAKNVYDCIGCPHIMYNPWYKDHIILPWLLYGVLSINSHIPSTILDYTAGICFIISRYALQTY